jgi:hypothetical protein
MVERLDVIEEHLKARSRARHETNDKIHGILGELSNRVDNAESELAELRSLAAETNQSLREIKSLLEGSLGQAGLAARVSALERWGQENSWKVRIMWSVGITLATPLGVALGGAVVWLLIRSNGGH